MRLKGFRIFLAVGCAVLAAAQVAAQPEVPAALEPWRDWVLYGQEFRDCPVLNGSQPGQRANHICAWPGELGIDVELAGAQFQQSWTTYDDAWVPLPGNRQYWPVAVTVDGVTQAVVDRGGLPSIRVTRGTHNVAGELQWTTRPASIPVPLVLGLVSLRLDGAQIQNPELEGGMLWLGLREGTEQDEDRLEVRVYRRLSDGLPIELETRIQLDVGGQGREAALTGALPAGFVGQLLSAPLPAQLDPDGTLRVQLRPGTWQLQLTAHADTLVESVLLADQVEPWPGEEIWSYAAAARLRVSALEGLDSIDGVQAGVPNDWRDLPAFRATPGQTMTIVERSRNDASEPNRLDLSREMWLDFDGGGYTVLDEVTGSMGNGWRLDMALPYVMTMAEADEENLLVTSGLESGLQGVEVRETFPYVGTTARIEALGSLAVSGYAERFDGVDTTLHLPPSYRLVAAPGADAVAGAWVERWRLLDLFLVLIITVATWRLFGAGPGIVALATMVLIFHEPAAPRWAWLNVLLAIAAARIAPAGRLRSFATRYRALSLIAVALLLIPFLITQLRVVVYPQFEQAVLGSTGGPLSAQLSAPAVLDGLLQRVQGDAAERRPRAAELPNVNAPATALQIDQVVVTGSRIEPAALTRYQPGVLVQTGPGLPDWAWNRYDLSWSGPVDVGQTFRMIMLSPWQLKLWRVAGVVLALVLVALLIRPDFRLPMGWFRGGAAAGALLLALILQPDPVRAQATNEFPSPELLVELRNRLTEPAVCHPQCAEFTSAQVAIDANTMSLIINVAAQDAVAIPLPIASQGWRPESIHVNGANLGLLYRGRDGRPWVSVESGVHTVELAGVLAPVDSFSLGFPMVPHGIDVAAPGWDSAGIVEGRLPSGALEFVRQSGEGADREELSATVFPPYVRVSRRVTFDLDWGVRTQVERVAPVEGAFTLAIDLLPGESILTPGIEVEDGRAIAAFTAVQREIAWESRLPLADTLGLTASADVPWAERWAFAVSHMWHADYDGFPASPPPVRDAGFFVPEYYPRPGESLTLALSRPTPASGDTIAIDYVEYERSVGERSAESVLYFEYRSTQGGEHSIVLPEGSELEGVSIDGDVVPLELDGRRLEIQKSPGEHNVEVQWRDLTGATFMSTLPVVELGGGASNLFSRLSLPQDRWVLFAYGPTLGPAVLYWAELVVFIFGAVVLGRIPMSPLKTHEWLLLGLGLSTFAWPVLFLFAAWAFVLSWRQGMKLDLDRRLYNLVQVLLALLTVATIAALVSAIPAGLLGSPEMQISSPVRDGPLSWFNDRSAGLSDSVGVVSISLWFYKAAMLAWALWLSFALLKWLRWAWLAYSHEGIWRGSVVAEGD